MKGTGAVSRAGKSSNELGFTRTELLVVLAALALLAGVAVPALEQARQNQGLGVCLGNQRAIAWALSAYEEDWGTFPRNYGWYPPGGVHSEWALGYLSEYLGGPVGVTDLRGLEIGEFPDAYVCPQASAEVFQWNPNTTYHACYWTNVAIRVNLGWNYLLFDYGTGHGPGWDIDSGGEARFAGKVCPNYVAKHWRSVYHPYSESVLNPNGMVFSGDTNNGWYLGGYHDNPPGAWHMRPGWGWVHGHLGFDRHGGKMVLSYVDGHARAFPEEELQDYSFWHSPDEATGDFMLNYIGEDGCGGTRIHVLPEAVTN